MAGERAAARDPAIGTAALIHHAEMLSKYGIKSHPVSEILVRISCGRINGHISRAGAAHRRLIGGPAAARRT